MRNSRKSSAAKTETSFGTCSDSLKTNTSVSLTRRLQPAAVSQEVGRRDAHEGGIVQVVLGAVEQVAEFGGKDEEENGHFEEALHRKGVEEAKET